MTLNTSLVHKSTVQDHNSWELKEDIGMHTTTESCKWCSGNKLSGKHYVNPRTKKGSWNEIKHLLHWNLFLFYKAHFSDIALKTCRFSLGNIALRLDTKSSGTLHFAMDFTRLKYKLNMFQCSIVFHHWYSHIPLLKGG